MTRVPPGGIMSFRNLHFYTLVYSLQTMFMMSDHHLASAEGGQSGCDSHGNVFAGVYSI